MYIKYTIHNTHTLCLLFNSKKYRKARLHESTFTQIILDTQATYYFWLICSYIYALYLYTVLIDCTHTLYIVHFNCSGRRRSEGDGVRREACSSRRGGGGEWRRSHRHGGYAWLISYDRLSLSGGFLFQICKQVWLFRILLRVGNLKRTQGWWSHLWRW